MTGTPVDPLLLLLLATLELPLDPLAPALVTLAPALVTLAAGPARASGCHMMTQ